MATSGDLTGSGLLYEGNYTEWRNRIDSLLKVHGVEIDKVSQLIYRDWHGLAEHQKAVKLITDQVSPALLGRVAAAETRTLEQLLLVLKAVATPFRFNDLPPELRISVYEYYFGSEIFYIGEDGSWKTLENAWEFMGNVPHPAVPDLLIASRPINSEALPVFYKVVHPTFDFAPHLLCLGTKPDRSSGLHYIRWWAQKNLKERNETMMVTVALEDRLGLTIKFLSNVRAEKKEAWEKHITSMEVDRKALGLQGEVLILCFTSRPELWID
ncbi:hypothetical protein LTR56_011111 [Elasticomyces elasticus]|nr:hypothetical protein LTR56_011111 [Elasticomyces elasticus]KAK3662468.1 hypothetical protein LTR22_006747 [Elasticomyces elasticus]KAK4926457.1 hypothetical protein LTR49_006664 [Elasticomyces elasticus]KAK5761169.1 hypothetical protein LTS12_008650 [Elasticomyces elasticus]